MLLVRSEKHFTPERIAERFVRQAFQSDLVSVPL
jgi:hypothetical protein